MARKKIVTVPVEAETGTATAVAEPPVKAKKSARKNRAVKTQQSPVGTETFEPDAVAAPIPVIVAPVPAEAAPFDSAPVPAASTPIEVEAASAVVSPVEAQHSVTAPVLDEQPDRPRVRSWRVRTDSGYEKLTDNKRGLLVLKFQDRPSEEILAAVKDAGFQYHPNYEDQGKVWLRKNDFEGRVQVDKIEAILRQQEQGAMVER